MALILIVEDDVFILQNAEWIVEDIGHLALSAGDAEEAFVHLSKSSNIDALFVDLRLGRDTGGGHDVADRAIVLQPGLRVLYTSGSPLAPDIEGRFVPGGQFIQKPYSPEQLGAALGRLLA